MPDAIAAAIERAMRDRSVTAVDVGEAINQPVRTVFDWLADASSMTLPTLVDIANFLQVLPSSFF
ncbi:hypothetical protein C1M55_28350 [Rhodococcus qingshengii]|uniref:helix-turn-helix transcriptional regulator n=1 Tax=Rhodococcus TaxID=1827 RepID=UPI000C9FC3D4|nr:helix-turn-helix transcriptional regulator [Rhodococcus qingshengii]AUS34643.1 hypothetical protein C1M55_28350 [Rhodococcus qingshengii]